MENGEHEVSIEDVRAAHGVVRNWLPKTPLYPYPLLSRLLGADYWIKHENHLPVGAFKVRGGVNLIHGMSSAQRQSGVIAVSTGNHGQSLAWASYQMGAACTIVVPEVCNMDKVRVIDSLGATVIKHGPDFDAAKEYCERLLADDGHESTRPRYVHSANEPALIAGVGTYALEILEDIESLDVVLVPVGLGSGICGTSIVIKSLRPEVKVIGVQAEGASAVTDSWRTGQLVSYPSVTTRAEGLATRVPAAMTLAIMHDLVDEMVLVSESEIDQAVRWLLDATHNLAEGAGAATLAAAWKIRGQLQGKTVVGVMSGGNMELSQLARVLEHTQPLTI